MLLIFLLANLIPTDKVIKKKIFNINVMGTRLNLVI